MARVCGENVQPSRRWLTDWDPVFRCWCQRSLALRLLPHATRRGKHFLPLDSGHWLTRQGQIEYIWSGKTSLGALFNHVAHSSSDLREDGIDGSSVLVSFVLVRPPLFRDGTSDTTSNKEQVLATVVPTVAIRRCVSIHFGPLFFTTPSEPPNSIFFSYILKAGT